MQEIATISRERLCNGESKPSKIQVGQSNLSTLGQQDLRRVPSRTLDVVTSSQGQGRMGGKKPWGTIFHFAREFEGTNP